MIEWILSSSVLIAVVALVRLLFKGRISLRLQYALWALVLLRLLIPFSFGSSPISVGNVATDIQTEVSQQILHENVTVEKSPDQEKQPQHGHTPSASVGQEDWITDEQPSHTPITPDLPAEIPENPPAVIHTVDVARLAKDAAMGIWLVGMVVVGLAFVIANLVFFRRIKRSRVAVDHPAGKLPLFTTEAVGSPCLYGLFRPAVYLNPQTLNDAKLIRHSIVHETTHYAHGDHIWSALRCVCLVLHWYNPLVWLAAFLSQRDAELACDESSILQLGEQERAEYGQTLIDMTCTRKTSKLILSTTMTDSGRGLRERIMLIVRKPRMAAYTLAVVILIALIAVGCTFTGGRVEDSGLEQTPTTEVTQPPVIRPGPIIEYRDPIGQTESTDPTEWEELPAPDHQDYTGPALEVGKFRDELDALKLSIAIRQTEAEATMEMLRYIVPGNQKVIVEALETALRHRVDQSSQVYSKGYDTGWVIHYEGKQYSIYTDGTIAIDFYAAGTVPAAYGYPVYAICKAAAQEAGLRLPVQPTELTDIRSATLEWNGVYSVTDKVALELLETRFSNSISLSGGAKCPFDAILTLALGNGKTVRLRMATDDCAAWMSEGVAYSFHVVTEDGIKDNTEFYSLFSADVIYDAMSKDDTTFLRYFRYIDWIRYAEKYGPKETFKVMDRVKNWVMNSSDKNSVEVALRATRRLDGYLADSYAGRLAELYQTHKEQFADYCLHGAYADNADDVVMLVAYDLNVPAEEIWAELKALDE